MNQTIRVYKRTNTNISPVGHSDKHIVFMGELGVDGSGEQGGGGR